MVRKNYKVVFNYHNNIGKIVHVFNGRTVKFAKIFERDLNY